LLAIARGLMATPRILVLDEPSLGLAPAMINELFDVLAMLRDDGVIILLVYQMAALALPLAAWLCILETGRTVSDAKAEALVHDPALEAAHRGHAVVAYARKTLIAC
jgi:branched-chain amino acid transport system permease protein